MQGPEEESVSYLPLFAYAKYITLGMRAVP